MAERCLQMSTGSCAGCPIRDEILPRRMALNRDVPIGVVAAGVEKDWCPDGTGLQLPEKPRVKVWNP